MRLSKLLTPFYEVNGVEAFAPTPNDKYLYDGNEFTVKPYLLDVYAYGPRFPNETKWQRIGIEVDGSKGHKKTKAQTNRDTQRTQNLLCHFPDIKIFRFDTKDLVGRGYVNPKTKRRSKILTDAEILAELGVKCTHI